MKHAVGFFLPLCIFSFLAFGISVAILGVEDTSTRTPEATLSSTTTRLYEEYSRIEAASDYGNLFIYPNDDDSTIIIADDNIIDDVTAYVKNNTLFIHCGKSFEDSFDFSDLFKGIFVFNSGDVTVFIPEKTYDAIYAANGTGGTTILDIAAKIADIYSGSGTIVYSQPEDFRSEQLSVSIGSGNGKLYNADTYNYSVEMGSGNINMYGLTGKGNIEIASGNCKLNYKELNGDIVVDMGSGNLDLNFPRNISAEIFADIGSGDIDIDYYNTDKDMDDGDTVEINGGKYKINVDMGSGNLDITDEVEHMLPDLPTLPPLFDTTAAVEAPVSSSVVATMLPTENNVVDIDLGALGGVNVDDDHVDVNVGPIDVDVDEDKVKVEIGDFKVDIG